ncbi:MAG: ribonuclease HI family protein [Elusimicrobiaceae bacterium]|nr:ribonuclease HI family protein [Elusimicrobiaceae bacterium]MBP5616866.1 ribonuclease HI family protein [Elusimicrobiaceae bacterium]
MQVKINIDGGSRGNPGPGAAAYVICDLKGKILSQEGYFMPHCTNNQAEYTALKLALIKCKELGASELFIEGDSLLLVKQFTGEYKIKNPDLQSRMQVIRKLAQGFTIHIKHVLREFNKAPDALANKAMDEEQSVGFNPIAYLPEDDEILAAPEKNNVVNGVEVTPVKRANKPTASKPAPQKRPHQPSLFD